MELKPGYKQTEVGVIPEDWEVSPVDRMGKVVTGKALAAHAPGEQRPYLRTKNVFDGRIDISDVLTMPMTDEQFEHFRVRIGDVLLNEGQSLELVGRCSIYRDEYPKPCAIQNQLIRFRAYSGVSPQFASYLFRRCQHTGVFAGIALQTTSIAHLGGSRFEALKLAWPPTLAEQEAIAGALSDADALIDSLEQLIAKKRLLKQGAMQDLLTGKRRLPGFEGEWEVKLLPEVSRFRGGKAHEQHIVEHGPYVCVNSKFISSDGKVRKYSSANFCSAKLNDVLMVMSDLPNGKALAKTFLADRDNFYAVNQRVCALTALDNYCGKFLSFILNRNPYFLKFDDGVSQTHLLNRVFENCPLILPPSKEEQTAIAAILSDMDAEIAALEAKLAKARQVKQGMMQELLTGRVRLVNGEGKMENGELG